MATVEDRFQAAVNVIKNLPKNGPYQPSTSMMLKFYGLYKQATEGPSHQKKPAFWDIVGKAKWDAWKGNQHLSKQQAMTKYVEELREIIETMSFNENVQNFVGSINGLDNIDLDDLEMISPGMKEMAESHPNSPFNSRTNSPQHGTSANKIYNKDNEKTKLTNGHVLTNGFHDTSDISNGSIVTLENRPNLEKSDIIAPTPTYPVPAGSMASMMSSNVDQSDDEYGDPVDHFGSDFSEAFLRNAELLKQIQNAVHSMNSDMISVNQRMIALEKAVKDVRAILKVSPPSNVVKMGGYPQWWPFKDISPAWFGLLILWPFMFRRIVGLISQRRQN